MMAEPIKGRSSKKVPTKKIIRVLLDSGWDGNLLFHKTGAAKQCPYLGANDLAYVKRELLNKRGEFNSTEIL